MRSPWLRAPWASLSPARAGFASEARARGLSFEEVREKGRWTSDSSLRIYLDVQGAAQISVTLRLKGLSESIQWAAANWLRYTPASSLGGDDGAARSWA